MTQPAPTSALDVSPPWYARTVPGAALLLLAVALAWAGSLSAPFEFDDQASIVGNASIRRLVPPDWLRPPATAGETVSGRPVLNFTFALNHAAGGLDVRGYRLVNLLIHAGTALAFWGILRRTPRVAPGVALAAALLWAVHPLQTAAVTYVVQRAESLAACLGLLTLYGFIRGAGAPAGFRWFVFAVACCLLGAGTKETIAVVPVVVLLYDRAFLAGTFRAAWRARGAWHAALFATWIPLLGLVVANRARGESAGFGTIAPWSYFLTQCDAIVRYLRLAVWPAGQVFDYGVPVAAGFGAVAGQFLLLAALAAATLWLLVRNRPAGFAGACFFLLLAPTSSFLPIATQTMAEHRMYLPLAIPVVLVVAGIAARLRRPVVGAMLVAGITVALGGATVARNAVFVSPEALWSDTVARRPDNPRAHYNLALALRAAGRVAEARAEFERTLALNPRHAFANYELGNEAFAAGQLTVAAEFFLFAVTADPHFVAARVNLGRTLAAFGHRAEALAHYEAALRDDPGAPDIRTNIAAVLLQEGRVADAEKILREVVAESPQLAEAHYHLGLVLAKSGASAAAETEFRAAVAMKSDAGAADAWFALGNLLARQERIGEAAVAFQSALERDPTHERARASLANCQLMTGQVDAAIANYEAVLRARPGDAAVQRNLEIAREMKRERR